MCLPTSGRGGLRFADTERLLGIQDSPRISIFSTAPTASEHVRVITDLRRDDLRGLAVAGAEGTLAEKKLRFGLLQGALHRMRNATVYRSLQGAVHVLRDRPLHRVQDDPGVRAGNGVREALPQGSRDDL